MLAVVAVNDLDDPAKDANASIFSRVFKINIR